MLEVLRFNNAFQKIANDKSRAIGVRKNDQTPGLGYPAQKPKLGLILHNAETGGFQNGRIYDLGKGILVIAALHNDRFPNLNHF